MPFDPLRCLSGVLLSLQLDSLNVTLPFRRFLGDPLEADVEEEMEETLFLFFRWLPRSPLVTLLRRPFCLVAEFLDLCGFRGSLETILI